MLENLENAKTSEILHFAPCFLSAEYGYARWTLQRLDRLRDDNSWTNLIFPITFDGRDDELEMDDIIENLRSLMDIAFKSVMGIEQYTVSNPHFQAAHSLFINDDGIPYGASMYGLFLNLQVASVSTVHPSMRHSENAMIENVQIHNLNHKMTEYLRMDKYHDTSYRNPYGAALDAHSVLSKQIEAGQRIDWSTVRYKGDALIDSYIVLDLLTDSEWPAKQEMFIGDEFVDWALGVHHWDNDDDEGHPHLGCNNDAMTMVPKGIYYPVLNLLTQQI